MPILKPIRAIQLNKSHPFARGLIGCWIMNEGGGSKVFDLSGNDNTGTFVGNTAWAAGKFGSCLSFDGSGDYVDVADKPMWDTGGQITVSLWFKTSTQQTSRGMLVHDVSGYKYLAYITTLSGRLEFYIRTLSGVSSANTGDLGAGYWSDGSWHHFVGVFNKGLSSNRLKLYVDGVEKATSDAYAENISTGDEGINIGRWMVGGEFAGQIDDAMIFDRALTAGEVAQLYREPFCMFDIATKLGLLYPAGQIIWLTAASTATSSVYGSLIKQSRLAGIIDAAAALSGILTWCYRGPVERQWLTEALFNGMTTSAFKLGTVLTGGWFWMRRTGCSVLYRGPSMERIDFANILAVAEQDAGSISPPDYIPHHSNSTYFYVVRRFNICGYQECTLAAAVKVAIDANGNLIEPKPNNIFAWRLDQVYGNKIQLIWFYCPLEQESKPESFRIYYDGGTGYINYENPIATVNYQGRKFYTYQSNALAAGRYLFAVRAEDAAGIENNSLAQLGIQLSTKSPDAINILSAEAV